MKWRGTPVIVLAAVAVAARLFALTFLHPLNWDEVEYFRATDWVRQGLVPYRDFWEHHTPLMWFLFAPVTALTDSSGAGAIILMRWAQVPLWIVAFWLVYRLMAVARIDVFSRWVAITLAVSSSLLMISAMEYRVDTLANALYVAAVVLLLRGRPFGAGVFLCLAGLANLRLGPLVAATALLGSFHAIAPEAARQSLLRRIALLSAGVALVLAVALGYFAVTGSLDELYQHVWVDNIVGEAYAERVPRAFLHRVTVPFGIRLYGTGPFFQWSGIDLAGAAIVAAGVIGLLRALVTWRRNPPLGFVAVLQIVNVFFIATMKFVYHYHLQIAVLLMLPFAALAIEPLAKRLRAAVTACVAVAALLSVVIVVFRGKELDLQYQDEVMRAVHRATGPGAKVFDGVGWAIRREPAYRFWFLPVLARELVAHGHAAPYTLTSWLADPPAAVITDRNAVVWLASHPELATYVVRHYLPWYRNLLLPGMSARLEAGRSASWIAPADGVYRVMASPALADYPWFRFPLAQRPGVDWTLKVQPSGAGLIRWTVDGETLTNAPALRLRRGARVTAHSLANAPLGVFLVSGRDPWWGRQPPPGVTLDAEGPREWHWPRLRARGPSAGGTASGEGRLRPAAPTARFPTSSPPFSERDGSRADATPRRTTLRCGA